MASYQEGKDSFRLIKNINLSSNSHRRKRLREETLQRKEQSIHLRSYAILLLKFPPPIPLMLLKRIGLNLSGVGKVRVMLRVSSGDNSCFFTVDKRKKQIALIDPSKQSSITENLKPTMASPKVFAFDAIFTEEDSQTEICSNALTDIIHAVINGMDGCLFCFGYAGLGKTYTMLGTTEATDTLGVIPCAISWLFRGIKEQRQKTGARFSVRVSCLELIAGQQKLKDLLVTHVNDLEHNPLQQHSELRAPSAERAAFYLDIAAAARQQEDSDTHMLYTLHVYQYNVVGKDGVADGQSRLHLIDIGNSERNKSSCSISLSGLGNILLAIFNGQKHLPYKEHKLAQLLKECLGSITCYATMIAHISPDSEQYKETLMTCQFASRIHHIHRRKIRFVNGGLSNNGSEGSSGEEMIKQNNECDPSSSDLSADTVIYVGPNTKNDTDIERPPVYIPSFDSGGNRCIMGKILTSSLAQKTDKILEKRSSVHTKTKIVKSSSQVIPNQTSPKTNLARKISLKIQSSKLTDSPINKVPLIISSNTSDEQWIDGPKISKSKIAEARYMLKNTLYKKETWIDGPMQLPSSTESHISQQNCSNYGFMDNHKKRMIRKWLENQSSIIQSNKQNFISSDTQQATNIKVATNLEHFKDLTTFKTYSSSIRNYTNDTTSSIKSDSLKINEIENITKKIGTKLNFLNMKSNIDSSFNLTNNPLLKSFERLSKTFDILEDDNDDDDDDDEIIVPPPLPLIEPLSNEVGREVSIENLNGSHKNKIAFHQTKQSLSSKNKIFKIVEVNDEELIPMQDSCLQVTEEDIAFYMSETSISKHPLKILNHKNLTIATTFDEIEQFPPSYNLEMLTRPYFNYEDFLEQENQHKFDQLARLHELYQNKLSLANVTNSITYQREKSCLTNIQGSKTYISIPIPIIIPTSVSSFMKIKNKIIDLESSIELNEDDYDSGTYSTFRAVKLSPATLSGHHAESSGYDSIRKDCETLSTNSISSRQTSTAQEQHNSALGALTSTLCGCFSSGTTGRIRAPNSTTSNSHNHNLIQSHKRKQTITWRN